MTLVKIIGHPISVMSVFLLILISGEQFGGFYLLYLLMGLPHGAPHAIIALSGLLAMFIGYKVHYQKVRAFKPLMYILSCLLMTAALFTFFSSSNGYNDSTFSQAIPLITLAIWVICVLSNNVLSLSLLFKISRQSSKPTEAAT